MTALRLTGLLALGLIACPALRAGAGEGDALAPGARLCLQRLSLPAEFGSRGEPLEGQLARVLRGAGFEVAEPAAVAAVEERVRGEVGGFVDPTTGERDWTRFRRHREQLGRALREELGCRAQLHAQVVRLQVAWSRGVAEWDGMQEHVSASGTGARRAYGYVGAFSLWLTASDLEGNVLAFRSGAIELLAKLAGSEFERVPEPQLLKDESVRLAIYRAIGTTGELLRSRGRP